MVTTHKKPIYHAFIGRRVFVPPNIKNYKIRVLELDRIGIFEQADIIDMGYREYTRLFF